MNTVGTILKKSRKSQNFKIEQVSSELKISQKTIKNIENDNIETDLNIVFYIGHVKSYSEYLGLNSKDIILQFKKEFSYEDKILPDKLPKPIINADKLRNQNIIQLSLISVIFLSFYFLFVKEHENSKEYALIPDLPENYIPLIEKSQVENDTKNPKKISDNPIEKFKMSSALASNNIKEDRLNNSLVTLKVLNSTWMQIRDQSDKIIMSKLMEKNEEYSYNINLNYNITTGNAGNILVIIDNNVRGKIGKYGEVLDSFTLDNSFKN